MRTTSLLAVVLFPASLLIGGCSADAKQQAEGLGRQSSAVQGGKSDTVKSHGYAVGIASKYGAVCSGTLIAPNLVLTARHCVVPPDGQQAVTCADHFAKNEPASALYVTTEPMLRGAQNFYQAKVITTPEDTSFCGNDIALIQLEENIPESEATPAIPVVQFSMSDHSKISKQITAMGYGITSPSAKDSGVRRIRESIDIVCVPGDASLDCKKTEYSGMLDSDKEFITKGYVCSGDSGGGAFDQATFDTGTPYVLGALSRGPQTSSECLAAIYSRTDAHKDLIVAAGEKAAAAGGYEPPAWLTAPAPASEEGTPADECVDDVCTSVSETAPGAAAPQTTTTTTTGCSASSSSSNRSSFGIFALAGIIGLIAARRSRRA